MLNGSGQTWLIGCALVMGQVFFEVVNEWESEDTEKALWQVDDQ